MAKPRTPNQKKKYSALNKRLNKYVSLVQEIYDVYSSEAASLVCQITDYSENGSKPFRFKDYPQTRNKINELLSSFASDIKSLIYTGTSDEWKNSNVVQDLLANDVLKVYRMKRNGEYAKQYYKTNNDALTAFQRRKDKGLTLSQKVWNQSANFKRELEYAISAGIERGQSAIALSKRISKYLHDFPSLQNDYKERYGEATDCNNCEYRSIRLARSEINIAYRTAEQTRWQQMDFIKGYEIKLSHSHPRYDVCDELAGIYPKWFKWTGWHPNCLCVCIPIVMTDDEWYNGNGKEITEVPQNYIDWCINNANRIMEASDRGTLPYFLKDNYGTTIQAINSTERYFKPITENDIRYLASKGIVSPDSSDKIWNILQNDTPDVAQKRIQEILTPHVSHSVFKYAEKYKEDDPEIKILLSSIERMDGNDEIAKIKKIEQLKKLCAEVCRKKLSDLGYVKSLSYIGTDLNFTISPETKIVTSQGVEVDIIETKTDLIVFKDKDGRKFAYPIGADETFFSASEASKKILEFPPYFRRGIKRVTFLMQESPYDDYWKIEYNNKNHHSIASDGGLTTFYENPGSSSNFASVMCHEAGHILDGKGHNISSSVGWKTAVAKDDELYSKYPVRNRVSSYAKTNDSEDFAECMSAYINDHEWFKEAFPNRAAFIREKAKSLSARYRK